MKLFVAINLPKEIKDYLWELKEEFRNSGKFNFVPKKNYHITLKFLGEVKEDKLKEIKEKLSKIKFNSFEISLNEMGHFNYRVLWVDSRTKEDVYSLAKKIDEQLIEYSNDHSFNDHITLARIKDLKNKEEFDKKLKTKIKLIGFRIGSFKLMKSETSKDGARYTVLEAYSIK